MTHPVDVDCRAEGDGWVCHVVVGGDASATEHDVRIDRAVRDALAPGAEVADLVRASFAFLLERESRDSILRAFDLPVIERYFPDYRAEIRRRVG